MTAGTSASLLAVLVLALSGCAGSDAAGAQAPTATTTAGSSAAPAAPAAQRIEVTLRAGEVSGDTGRVPVGAGERVTLLVTSDVADEIHLHGYELTAVLEPGAPAELTFDATLPGVFEVELHEAGTVLLTLQVG